MEGGERCVATASGMSAILSLTMAVLSAGDHVVASRSVFGTTVNPFDHTRAAGGSSGGAAVSLALHMLPVADGSDYMGSLRNPAAWNHVFGFRPSQGRVPSFPARDHYVAQMGREGPMGRSVADAFLSMYLFETVCTIQVRAMAGGTELVAVDPRIIATAQQQAAAVTKGLGSQLTWPGLLRRLDRIDAERDYVRLHVGERSYLLLQTVTGLEARLDALHAEPGFCSAVLDVEAAHAAGLPVIAVSWGYTATPPDKLGANAVVDRFDRLPEGFTRGEPRTEDEVAVRQPAQAEAPARAAYSAASCGSSPPSGE